MGLKGDKNNTRKKWVQQKKKQVNAQSAASSSANKKAFDNVESDDVQSNKVEQNISYASNEIDVKSDVTLKEGIEQNIKHEKSHTSSNISYTQADSFQDRGYDDIKDLKLDKEILGDLDQKHSTIKGLDLTSSKDFAYSRKSNLAKNLIKSVDKIHDEFNKEAREILGMLDNTLKNNINILAEQRNQDNTSVINAKELMNGIAETTIENKSQNEIDYDEIDAEINRELREISGIINNTSETIQANINVLEKQSSQRQKNATLDSIQELEQEEDAGENERLAEIKAKKQAAERQKLEQEAKLNYINSKVEQNISYESEKIDVKSDVTLKEEIKQNISYESNEFDVKSDVTLKEEIKQNIKHEKSHTSSNISYTQADSFQDRGYDDIKDLKLDKEILGDLDQKHSTIKGLDLASSKSKINNTSEININVPEEQSSERKANTAALDSIQKQEQQRLAEEAKRIQKAENKEAAAKSNVKISYNKRRSKELAKQKEKVISTKAKPILSEQDKIIAQALKQYPATNIVGKVKRKKVNTELEQKIMKQGAANAQARKDQKEEESRAIKEKWKENQIKANQANEIQTNKIVDPLEPYEQRDRKKAAEAEKLQNRLNKKEVKAQKVKKAVVKEAAQAEKVKKAVVKKEARSLRGELHNEIKSLKERNKKKSKIVDKLIKTLSLGKIDRSTKRTEKEEELVKIEQKLLAVEKSDEIRKELDKIIIDLEAAAKKNTGLGIRKSKIVKNEKIAQNLGSGR